MFKKNKCSNCGGKISKDFEFCPYCGNNLQSDSGNYGFLGKSDSENLEDNLPFGFGAVLKPLMKELTKQMSQLDKELKRDNGKDNFKNTGFSVNFSTPGHKPIKIKAVGPNARKEIEKKKPLELPKFSEDKLRKMRKSKREEPKTSVRRLSDSVVYELDVPKVDSLENVNITKLENSFEIKAISEDVVYEKNIEVSFPLVSYSLENSSLILEFGAK